MKGHVFLVGMPGSGKSTVGRALAERLGMPFVDLDEDVERAAGMPIVDIFRERGQAGFRELERGELERVAAGVSSVVACGGGVPLDEDNRALMRSTGTVVALTVSLPRLAARTAGHRHRPLINNPVDIERIDRERERVYWDIAHHHVSGEDEPDDVARTIAELLA